MESFSMCHFYFGASLMIALRAVSIFREDDVEDKLVVAPEGIVFKQAEIEKAIYFQEKYYKSKVEVL